MKQVQQNQNINKLQHQPQAKLSNNALLRNKNGQNKNPSALSFKNQLAQVQEQAGAERNNNPFVDQRLQQQSTGEGQKEVQANNFSAANTEGLTEEQQKMLGELQQMRQDDLKKETRRKVSSETEKYSSEDLAQKTSESENSKANASQANQKQITEALREGNQAQQQANYQDANDSRKHLENWEELAPKVVEDIKNRAVRIDIPGIKNVETLIVRMQGNSVSIQVVGDEKSMAALQKQESLLAALLARKNVNMAGLQAIDVMKVPAKNRAFANA